MSFNIFKRRKKVRVKKLRSNAVIPTAGSKHAAGYDLHACINKSLVIEPGKTMQIGTGLSFELPHGYFGGIFARSGLGTKYNLRPANCVGVCDEDYRGEYIVYLYNDSNEDRIITPGDRIAQLVLLPYEELIFEEVMELSDTERGDGGFGSTGV